MAMQNALLDTHSERNITAFVGFDRIAQGPRTQVLHTLRSSPIAQDVALRAFDDTTGERLDLAPELRPVSQTSIEPKPEAAPVRSVGRPKLGVVAREITLLPRHWEWLARQPGGASCAIRKLLEDARSYDAGSNAPRISREAAYRFMTDIAGDLTGFEEATRALFAGKRERFEELVQPWPDDVRAHLAALAAESWGT